jgi:hypothetical protein
MSKPERQKYKIAGPATWELIRAAYLAGESAPALAERFGVSAHAIRKRISVEGWSKRAYAEALEARGVAPPEKPKTVNFAERFAASYVPPPAPVAPSEEAHPFMDLVAALKEASTVADAGKSREPEAVSAEPPVESAAELERRAMAQTGAALSKGRANDAKMFAALADQMRKRMAEEALPAEQRRSVTDDDRHDFTYDLFGKIAYVAAIMLHAPAMAPAGFIDLIKRWREINLGEGEDSAELVARRIAEANAHYLNGNWIETMPEDVQWQMQRDWKRYREKGRMWQWGPEYLAECGTWGKADEANEGDGDAPSEASR